MATSTLGSGTLVLAGTTSGTTTVTATAVAGTTTLTLPAATDTLVGRATTDTLTNKTLTSPTITGGALNGTLGATTPSTGAFTTITATGGFTSNTTITAQLDGSDSAGAGPGFNLFNTAFTRGWRTQLSASNNKVDYYFNGAAYVQMTTLNTNGALALSGASTSANGVGITFPATQSASTDANTLDDYEEGTWTPTWSVSGGTIAAVNNEGFYTKVGRQVFVGGYIAYGNSTTGTPTGALSIAGLPFTSSTGYGQGGGKQAGRGYAGYNFWGTNPQTTLGIAASGTTLALSAVYTDMSRGFSNSDQVYFFATYFV